MARKSRSNSSWSDGGFGHSSNWASPNEGFGGFGNNSSSDNGNSFDRGEWGSAGGVGNSFPPGFENNRFESILTENDSFHSSAAFQSPAHYQSTPGTGAARGDGAGSFSTSHTTYKIKNQNPWLLISAGIVAVIVIVVALILVNAHKSRDKDRGESMPAVVDLQDREEMVEDNETGNPIFIENNTRDVADVQDVSVPSGMLDSSSTPYEIICDALSNNETTITLYGVSEQQATDAYEQVTYDHPEFFWADYGYVWTTYMDTNGSRIELQPNLTESMSSIIRKEQQLETAVDSILGNLTADMTDYDKVLYIHDYLVQNTVYDEASYAYMQANPNQTFMFDCSTAYGCLVNHEAVCAGYSKGMQLLLNRIGVECGRVSGVARNDDHEWNYLVLDGEFYYLDVTWDDPVGLESGASPSAAISHEYFCITTDALLYDHVIGSENKFVPSCSSTKYDYYRYNGLYMEQYSLTSVKELVPDRMVNNSVQMEFSSPRELRTAIDHLFESGEIFDIPYVQDNASTVWHSIGTSERVLTITLE